MANRVQDVMTGNPKTLKASSSIMEAARMMRDSDIGDVIVVDDSGKVYGIVTDRDLVIRAIASGEDPKSTRIESVCSREMTVLHPTQTTDEAVKLMKEKAIRRLPVVDGETVVGVVSLGDLATRLDERSALGQISVTAPNR